MAYEALYLKLVVGQIVKELALALTRVQFRILPDPLILILVILMKIHTLHLQDIALLG